MKPTDFRKLITVGILSASLLFGAVASAQATPPAGTTEPVTTT
ncbi:hypothetical protein BH24DEI1_BH24DEI1_01450 [soil metagenome]